MNVKSFEVQSYVDGDGTSWILCSICKDEVEEQDPVQGPLEHVEEDEDELLGLECEECTAVNPSITLEMFDEAVDTLCGEIDADRTSIEVGEFENEVEDYKVEISGQIELPFDLRGEIGGWVTLQKYDETIWCTLGIKIDDELVADGMECFKGQYDYETGWDVSWESM